MYLIPECCICRLSLKKNLCVEKNCGNIFHYACMKKWISVQKSCPLCKCTCYKKNLLYIYYEINEENKININENLVNKSKDELCEALIKYEAELIKTQNENEKYSLEILTLTNKNKILSDTINKNNVKMNEDHCEKLKLKELKDAYLKDKIFLTTKIEEYDKELKKYKIVQNYLDDLNKEDLNKINLLFGFNILTLEEQQNVIHNYIKNCLSNQKKNEIVVKELNKNITEKDDQIQSLKEKLYKYKLNHDITDSNEQVSNDENDTKTIKIKNKIIRRVKTLESVRKNNRNSNNNSIYSKSKTANHNSLLNNSIGFMNFLNKKMNSSESPEQVNVTPKKRKYQPIEIDLLRNKSVDKIFNNLTDKNYHNENKKEYNSEVYSNTTDSGQTVNSLHNYKTQTPTSTSLKLLHTYKINRNKNRKSFPIQSTKITDFFRRI
ncbi:conserved Plasmodium protein, unknown function [Plasmodium malariae]|uniref:RING-type domain-containing protein n=1 Tax=Plasmodium malariae TaxID=5858 RepID=A0A1C3L0N2_PLAMA|nr:conserved Plasmodium protein, unknown function [Plasmodium malariae]